MSEKRKCQSPALHTKDSPHYQGNTHEPDKLVRKKVEKSDANAKGGPWEKHLETKQTGDRDAVELNLTSKTRKKLW